MSRKSRMSMKRCIKQTILMISVIVLTLSMCTNAYAANTNGGIDTTNTADVTQIDLGATGTLTIKLDTTKENKPLVGAKFTIYQVQ